MIRAILRTGTWLAHLVLLWALQGCGNVSYVPPSSAGSSQESSVTPPADEGELPALPTPNLPAPAPTAVPTPAATPSVSEIGEPVAAGTFTNMTMTEQTNTFTIRFTAIPSTSSGDLVIGLGKGFATEHTQLAVIVRFNRAGLIDARNWFDYDSDNDIPYVAGMRYSFRIVVDVRNKSYSAYVAPERGTEEAIGLGFDFREEQDQVSALDHIVKSENIGSVTLSDISVDPR